MEKFHFILLVIIFLSFLIFQPLSVKAGVEDNVWGWAWSENLGWVSFNSINCDYDGDGSYEGADEGGPSSRIASYCPSVGSPCLQGDPNCPYFCDFDQDGVYEGAGEGARTGCPDSQPEASYGVHICESDTDPNPKCEGHLQGDIVGYAWSENIGWIRFNPPGAYPDLPFVSSQVMINPLESGAGCFQGWARACFVYEDSCDCGDTCTTLKDNTKRGDLEGWLRMGKYFSDSTCQNIYVYLENSYQGNFTEFHAYAWGAAYEDFYLGAPLGWIGWLSFNDHNCDLNDDGIADLRPGCPTGQPISEYFVASSITFAAGGNQPPYIADSSVLLDGDPQYCNIGPGKGQIRFKWTYGDNDGDDQLYYHLQIDDNSDFSSPEVDCIAQSTVAVGLPPNNENTGTSSVIAVAGTPTTNCSASDFEIAYNTSYYWRVKVVAEKDDQGSCYVSGSCDTSTLAGCRPNCISSWSQYDDATDSDGDGNNLTFTTIPYAYPWPDFSYVPLYPKVSEKVVFTDNSLCYDPSSANGFIPNVEYTCHDGDGSVFFEWDFDYNDNPPGSGFDPTLLYTALDYPETITEIFKIYNEEKKDNIVRLRVRDDFNPPPGQRICYIDKSFDVKIPMPKWKEMYPF